MGFPLVARSALILLALAADAAAAERERAAHVHGVARLNVAIEGQTVEMELMSPGADIVGFEHAPETAAQRAAVVSAAAALEDGAALFAFPPEAGCRLSRAEVESALLDRDHGEGEAHEPGAEVEREAHAEFEAEYRFRCERPDRLSHVDVRLFELFPAARALVVQSISPRGQSAEELTPSSARLKF